MSRAPGSLSEFARVIELSADEQQALLTQGDGVERLWASWALALRDQRRAHPELLQALQAEPNAGTRCLVATILAGFGDQDALGRLAASDPEPLVRETAVRLLARIGAGGALLRDVLQDRMAHDPAPRVRAALIGFLGDDNPVEFAEQCASLLGDTSTEVRGAAANRIVALLPYGANFPGEFSLWLRALPDAAPEVVARVLDRWDLLGVRLGWDALGPLVERNHPLINERLWLVLDPAQARPGLGWLLDQTLRDWSAETAPLGVLVRVLASLRPGELSRSEADRCRSLHKTLKRARPASIEAQALQRLLSGASPGTALSKPRRRR